MPKHRDYADDQTFHATNYDALNEFLATVKTNLRLKLANTTTVRADPADVGGQMGAIIQGGWRFNTAAADAAHPGGGAGTYAVWATTRVLDASAEDAGTFNYTFGLRITTNAGTPSGTGSEALYVRVGSVVWNGSQITLLTQTGGDAATPIVHGPSHSPGASDALPMTDWHLAGLAAARPTATTTLNGARYLATDTGAEWQCVAGAWVAIGSAAPVTSPIGAMTPYAGDADPDASWFVCDGRAISRATYAVLFGRITKVLTGTLTNGGTAITGLSSTADLFVGERVTGTGIPNGATIASITSGTAITISGNATAGGAQTLTFYPFGAGDGISTFNIPAAAGRSVIGSGQGSGLSQRARGQGSGATWGEETHILTTSEIPPHEHYFAESGGTQILVPHVGGGNALPNGASIIGTTGYNGGFARILGGGVASPPHNNMAPFIAMPSIIRVL